MCGRFVRKQSKAEIRKAFQISVDEAPELGPSYNVAPTQSIDLVRERPARDGKEKARELDAPKWGLVPAWAKDPKIGARTINARMETITEKPMFRHAALKRRGIVPASGYYEWMKNPDGSKTPIYLHPENEDELLGFAALYEFWPDPTKAEDDPGKWLMTATILTREATDALGHVHDRCPVILPGRFIDFWLDPDLKDKEGVQKLLLNVPEPHLVPREVDKKVGSVRNNGPELIKPVTETTALFKAGE
ncbi:SOS response-associated peptidase [Paenarthrobacter sp. DKR-5]|uniref:SOS response-associated peptidase n=1 Tax=Paenarthrobacter sp. DKR-5 TaxID=2835535 RepID=UPI001BDC94E7|nr:SOS response-associated peptidase [Paenarthrobacter sp. DKR-5]MBT1003552.1 SOS response-associated peptidase [Paenarthrobacter sp. DKR-5]